MTSIKAFIKSHVVPIYFALAFAISWGGLLAIDGLRGMSGDTWQSDPRLPFFFVAMLAGPSTAALLLTSVVSGRTGFRELLSSLLRWRVGTRWYAVALLTAPVVFTAVHLALSLASPVFLPSIVTMSGTASFLMFSVAGALAVGFFEELGWTGFANPRRSCRHTGCSWCGSTTGPEACSLRCSCTRACQRPRLSSVLRR
jgi:CAAX protease family protein